MIKKENNCIICSGSLDNDYIEQMVKTIEKNKTDYIEKVEIDRLQRLVNNDPKYFCLGSNIIFVLKYFCHSIYILPLIL